MEERLTAVVQREFARDPAMVVWWGTEPECVSAVSRLEREHALELHEAEAALSRLDALRGAWHEIEPSPSIRTTARRLLRVHPLSAADALQLAACIVGSAHAPNGIELVTLDHQLDAAARREGIAVADFDGG